MHYLPARREKDAFLAVCSESNDQFLRAVSHLQEGESSISSHTGLRSLFKPLRATHKNLKKEQDDPVSAVNVIPLRPTYKGRKEITSQNINIKYVQTTHMNFWSQKRIVGHLL